MSLRTFTENVVILALENQLISELPGIFTPRKVVGFDEETLQSVAGESEDVRKTRQHLTEELESLRKGLQCCRGHLHPGLTSSYPPPILRCNWLVELTLVDF